jgi:uncharacterized protein (TIGR02246 family)
MHGLSRFFLTSALLAASIAPAFAADVTNAELMQAATDLGHRYDENYAAKKPEAMAALYETDGVLVSPAGPVVRGKDALVDYYKKRFASGATGHHIVVQEVHVQGNGGYSIADFSVNVQAKGRSHVEKGKIVGVYRKDADGWHLELVQPSVPAKAG